MKQSQTQSQKHAPIPNIISFSASPALKILATDSKPHSRLSNFDKNSPDFLT